LLTHLNLFKALFSLKGLNSNNQTISVGLNSDNPKIFAGLNSTSAGLRSTWQRCRRAHREFFGLPTTGTETQRHSPPSPTLFGLGDNLHRSYYSSTTGPFIKCIMSLHRFQFNKLQTNLIISVTYSLLHYNHLSFE